MKIFWAGLLIFLGLHCNAQEVKVMRFEDFENFLNQEPVEDKILLVNFWATWCKPCIVEMPHFEEAAVRLGPSLKLIFVSLDFVENLENKVKPFLNKRGIVSQVILLNDTDYNSWINRVSPDWTGAIPATLIIDRQGAKHFFEREFDKASLEALIDRFIKS